MYIYIYIHIYTCICNIFIYIYTFIYIIYIHILLYTASWRYKKNCFQASINTLFYIKFYIINTMKKHKTLLHHVCSYNTKNVPI